MELYECNHDSRVVLLGVVLASVSADHVPSNSFASRGAPVILENKADRIEFHAYVHAAAIYIWLHRYHSETLACNVKSFARFGFLKDLLEIPLPDRQWSTSWAESNYVRRGIELGESDRRDWWQRSRGSKGGETYIFYRLMVKGKKSEVQMENKRNVKMDQNHKSNDLFQHHRFTSPIIVTSIKNPMNCAIRGKKKKPLFRGGGSST
jgi:hypothetical protein